MKTTLLAVAFLGLIATGTNAQQGRPPRAPSALPDPPEQFSLVPGEVSGTEVMVSWVPPPATLRNYEIEYSASTTPAPTIITVPPDQHSVVIPTLAANTFYSLRIRSVDLAGVHGIWSPVTVTFQTTPGNVPTAPTGLQILPGGLSPTAVNMGWTDNASNELSYRVAMLSPGENPNDPILWDNVSGDLAIDSTSFPTLNLQSASMYQFKVRARNADGYSAYSNVVVVTTPLPLAAPTNLTVTDVGPDSVQLAWQDNAVGETAYRVAVLPPNGNPANEQDWNNFGGDLPANATTVDVTGLTQSRNYQFRVRAKDGSVLPPLGPVYSPYSSNVAQRTSPGVPANLAAPQRGLDWMMLTWQDNAVAETAYRVAVLPPNGNPANEQEWNNVGGDLPPNTTSYTVPGLQSGTTYQFRVRAKDGTVTPAIYSPYSNTIIEATPAPLTTPTNLTVAQVGPDWIRLTWQDNAVGETYYRVSILPPGADPQNENAWNNTGGNLPADTTTYTAPGLTINTAYRFRVRCSNVNVVPTLYSNYSSIVQGQTYCPLPPAPTNLHASVLTDTCIVLAWTDNANDEIAYRVALLPPGGNPNVEADWVNIGGNLPPDTTTYVHPGLTAGATYGFRVRAQNACDYGAYSSTLTIQAVEQPPPAPTSCTATRQGTNTSAPQAVLVQWNWGSAPVSGFRVARLDPGEDPNNASNWDNYGGDLAPSVRQYLNNPNDPPVSLVNGQTYTYKVRAFIDTPCGRIYSNYSNTDTAVP